MVAGRDCAAAVIRKRRDVMAEESLMMAEESLMMAKRERCV
jgi:hypothetical protein